MGPWCALLAPTKYFAAVVLHKRVLACLERLFVVGLQRLDSGIQCCGGMYAPVSSVFN